MALALVALLLLAGLAVALGLGVPGIRIILIGPSPSSSPTSSPSASPLVSPSPTMTLIESLRLGQSVDLALLDVAAGFHVRRPDLAGLGTPDAAVLSLAAGAHQASLLYVGTAAQGLGTGDPAALLITEFPATISRDFLDKYVATGTTVVPVHVHTQAGYWLSGAPHELAYLDPHGQVILDRVRLAGNVLLWNDGTVTYRIEGARDLAAALAIAGSLR